MSRSLIALMITCACLCGCGGKRPAEPETQAEGATRVFAIAENLESQRKLKQATEAYQQVIRLFPDSPEARKAADRIAKAQRDASERVRTRKR